MVSGVSERASSLANRVPIAISICYGQQLNEIEMKITNKQQQGLQNELFII